MVYSAFVWNNSGIMYKFGIRYLSCMQYNFMSSIKVTSRPLPGYLIFISSSAMLKSSILVVWLKVPQRKMFLNSSWYSLRNSFSKMSMDEISIALISMKSIVLRCYPSKSQQICSTFHPVLLLGSPPC